MICVVCLSLIGENHVLTWCGHYFHAPCIAMSLTFRPHCPLCRSLLLPTIEEEDEDEEEEFFLAPTYFRQLAVIDEEDFLAPTYLRQVAVIDLRPLYY